MDLPRASGILLHPSSLPGPFGIGDLGPAAYRFVDFLVRTGQRWWQMLPLGPTGYGNSPYMCFSAFAGNGLLISPEVLVEEKLLDQTDLSTAPVFPVQRVDYGRVIPYKTALLTTSYQRFRATFSSRAPDDFSTFCAQHAFWLEDYALFTALKAAHGGAPWSRWEEGAATRQAEALGAWGNRLADEVQCCKYVQYTFFKQWAALRRYCHAHGIRILGDMPLYVAYDSAEVWANRHLFRLNAQGHPLVVAGVPPDYFSATGQRWGNPIYRWEAMAQSGYQWWIDRFRMNFALVDMLRLDHFRGFDAYWESPATDLTARNGRWVQGPGVALFNRLHQALGALPMLAEDLGVITPEVDALREHLGLPGMRILQMAFGHDPKAPTYRPHNHIQHCVIYTATHDHNTTVGWFTAAPGSQTTQGPHEVETERESVLQYVGTDGTEIHWDMIRLALGSVACMALFPLQDVLGLGTQARMNRPGTLRGNWEWRFTKEMLIPSIQERLRALTRIYERGPSEARHAAGDHAAAES